MRYLKRISENNESSEFKQYISYCLVDLIDNYQTDIEFDEDDNGNLFFEISVNFPRVEYKNEVWSFNLKKDLDDRIKYSKELLEFYQEIEEGINKVKIKYPNLKIDISIEKEGKSGYTIDGTYSDLFEAYYLITFEKPFEKNVIKKKIGKGKLGTINFSELDRTWDVRDED